MCRLKPSLPKACHATERKRGVRVGAKLCWTEMREERERERERWIERKRRTHRDRQREGDLENHRKE